MSVRRNVVTRTHAPLCGSLHGLAIDFKPGRGPPARTGAGMNDLAWSEDAVCGICLEPLGADSTANPWTGPGEMKATQACVNGHVFHKGCLIRSMRGVTGRKCPDCMQPMLKEVCDRLERELPQPRAEQTTPEAARQQLPQPGPPQTYHERNAMERARARSANTPEGRLSGQAELVAAETRVARVRNQIEETEEQIVEAVQRQDVARARNRTDQLAHLNNILRYQREVLANLQAALANWHDEERRLVHAYEREVAAEIRPGSAAAFRRARAALEAYRALRDSPGWVATLAHQANRRQREGEQNRRRMRARYTTEGEAPVESESLPESNDESSDQDPDWVPPRNSSDDDDDDDGDDGLLGDQD
jgi:hypothetical protein